MKVVDYIKRLAAVEEAERADLVEAINIQNYAMNMLSETDMWILRTAAENAEYLSHKLKEADETLAMDTEAPEEEETLSLDVPAEETTDAPAADLTLDTETTDAPAGDGEELSLDVPAEETTDAPAADLTLDTETTDAPAEETTEEKPEIETSLEGVGILPLLAEIQEKLANGKPSEVELAALKAMKKLF